MILLVTLIAGLVVLTPVADRLRVPQPIVLLVYGLVLALVPGLPEPALNADLVLPVVLPPLLFAATQRTTVGQFRDAAGPVVLLAVGLTVATAVVAAGVGRLAGLPWPAAAVLGAIVSPPDPVAATAVARRLRLPERMVTILEAATPTPRSPPEAGCWGGRSGSSPTSSSPAWCSSWWGSSSPP